MQFQLLWKVNKRDSAKEKENMFEIIIQVYEQLFHQEILRQLFTSLYFFFWLLNQSVLTDV